MKNKILLSLISVLLIVSVFTGCTNNKKENSIVTKLKGGDYSYSDFRNDYILTVNLIMQQYGIETEEEINNLLIQDLNGKQYDEVLKNGIIEQKVVAQLVENYCKEKKKNVSDAQIEEGYQNYLKYSVDSNEELKELFKLNNIDSNYIKSVIKSQLYSVEFSKLISDEIDEEVKSNPDVLKKEIESVSAKHILVKTEEEAKKVKERLEAGEVFEDLAVELSEDKGSAKYGGDLGSFQRGVMIPEFENVAFSMEVGDISEPVQSSFGYHIIKLESKKTYADVLDSIQKRIDELKDDNAEDKDLKEELKEEYDMTKEQLIYKLSQQKMYKIAYELLSNSEHVINDELFKNKIEIIFPTKSNSSENTQNDEQSSNDTNNEQNSSGEDDNKDLNGSDDTKNSNSSESMEENKNDTSDKKEK